MLQTSRNDLVQTETSVALAAIAPIYLVQAVTRGAEIGIESRGARRVTVKALVRKAMS